MATVFCVRLSYLYLTQHGYDDGFGATHPLYTSPNEPLPAEYNVSVTAALGLTTRRTDPILFHVEFLRVRQSGILRSRNDEPRSDE
jgi:hypothetical protein